AVNAFPFLRAADAFIGDTVAAETVLSDLWLHIGKAPAGRQGDKQHPVSGGEYDAVCFRGSLTGNGVHHSAVNRPPELLDFRIRLTPCGNHSVTLVLGQTNLQRDHCYKCAIDDAVS